jgi:hypothetical protein
MYPHVEDAPVDQRLPVYFGGNHCSPIELFESNIFVPLSTFLYELSLGSICNKIDSGQNALNTIYIYIYIYIYI